MVAADADETGSGAMDVDAAAGSLSVEDASKMKCFDLKNLGDDAWALVADARGGKPCPTCTNALKQDYSRCKGVCKHEPAAVGKRGTRDRKERGATEKRIQAEIFKRHRLIL